METYLFLNSALCHENELGEWRYSSMPRPLYPREKNPHTHLMIGGWVDPRVGLDAVAKRNFPNP